MRINKYENNEIYEFVCILYNKKTDLMMAEGEIITMPKCISCIKKERKIIELKKEQTIKNFKEKL